MYVWSEWRCGATTTAVSGLSLALVQGGETAYLQGYGAVSRDDGAAAVTPDTRFGVGSLTKAFVTALLGQLLREHK